jgi:LacI family transcriptional regulator
VQPRIARPGRVDDGVREVQAMGGRSIAVRRPGTLPGEAAMTEPPDRAEPPEPSEPPGRPANIAGVARLAGVSVGTVSNVLNNPHLVSAVTRERVEAVLRRTGFVRNAAARQLTGAPSASVGCVLLDLSNPYFAEIARGLEDGLAEQGCLAIMCSTDVDTKREQHYLQLLLETRVRAVVLNSVEAAPTGLDAFLEKGIPVVLLDNPRQRRDLCGVGSDSVAGGRLAADHLLDLGHRRIALLRHDVGVPALRDRVTGVHEAVSARGLQPWDVLTEVYLEPPGHHGDPGPALDSALAGPDPCTAFLCYNDMAALKLLSGLRDRGISVPGDVSVVGYDDLAFARLLSPALTTIRQPTYDLGRAAARLVLAEARPGHVHRQAAFTPALVVRGSTGPPPGR